MRRVFFRSVDYLLFTIALLLFAAFLQGFSHGGWFRRIQYTSLGVNAWRERIYTITWERDALEFQFDRTDYLILETCECASMGRSRWNLFLTNGTLRGPHARDLWRNLAIGASSRTPDPSQHIVTFWLPQWLAILVFAAPVLSRSIRRRIRAPGLTRHHS